MKNLKNTLSNIFLGFAIIILISAIIFVVTGDRNDHKRFFFNLRIYQTLTGSMHPYMKINSIVVVRKAAINEFKVGDVVSFIRDDTAITHRVIGISGEGLETKGDNSSATDSLIVASDEIIGKEVLVINGIATLTEQINMPFGVLKVIVIPILFILVIILGISYFKIIFSERKGS